MHMKYLLGALAFTMSTAALASEPAAERECCCCREGEACEMDCCRDMAPQPAGEPAGHEGHEGHEGHGAGQ